MTWNYVPSRGTRAASRPTSRHVSPTSVPPSHPITFVRVLDRSTKLQRVLYNALVQFRERTYRRVIIHAMICDSLFDDRNARYRSQTRSFVSSFSLFLPPLSHQSVINITTVTRRLLHFSIYYQPSHTVIGRYWILRVGVRQYGSEYTSVYEQNLFSYKVLTARGTRLCTSARSKSFYLIVLRRGFEISPRNARAMLRYAKQVVHGGRRLIAKMSDPEE